MSRAPISKLSKDPEALAFLKKHNNDPVIGGGFTAVKPYHSFPKILNFKRKKVVDAIFDVIDSLPKHEQEILRMFLEMTPRAMAKALDWPRGRVYQRVRYLRDKCVKLSAAKREALINQRAADQRDAPECPPASSSRRSISLTFKGETRVAYFLERTGQWCDESGLLYSADICEILDNAREDLGEDGVLDFDEVSLP